MEHAVEIGDTTFVKRQFEARLANPDDETESMKWTGLTTAANNGNMELVKIFVEAGANVNHIGTRMPGDHNLLSEPLYQALNFPNIYDYLLAHGAKVPADDASDYAKEAQARRRH